MRRSAGVRHAHSVSLSPALGKQKRRRKLTLFRKRQSPTGYAWGSETVRGVNIGGWLVLEP